MTFSEIKTALYAGVFGKDKNKVYFVWWGFFYTHGMTSDKKAEFVKSVFLSATIVSHEEIWKDFRGGAALKDQSHFLVKFPL